MEEEPGSPGPPPLEDQNGMEVTAPVQRSARAIQAEIHKRQERERERKNISLTALNPYIVCGICNGYLIDPVTAVECLHSCKCFFVLRQIFFQCSGSGSESGYTGSTCFWASRIRILLSLSKYSKKNLNFYCFVTFFDFLSLKMMYKYLFGNCSSQLPRLH
jgi:hypothetical protein